MYNNEIHKLIIILYLIELSIDQFGLEMCVFSTWM